MFVFHPTEKKTRNISIDLESHMKYFQTADDICETNHLVRENSSGTVSHQSCKVDEQTL